MTQKTGLWVNGESVSRDGRDFHSVLKYALVAPDARDNAAFRSGDMGTVLSCVDDLSVEIAMGMIGDYVAHEFSDPDEMFANIALRKCVISAMKSICAGEIDGDYTEAQDGVPPTLGYLKNLEVLFTPGAGTGQGILTAQAPFVAPDAAWCHLPDTGSWSSFIFMQQTGTQLSQALRAITPFRGECAGALQLAILLGYLNGVGAAELDALTERYGPAFIGAWRMRGSDDHSSVPTLASRFLRDGHDVADNYDRGGVIAVPGDYLYFRNKDDYALRAPEGGWRGENCIYMGQDCLGNPHYSGLGLGWKTEFALRMFLGNAYMTDANAAYLEQRRSGGTPETGPAIIEDAKAQVRFVKRAIMRCPAAGAGTPPEMRLPAANPEPPSDRMIREQLDLLEFRKVAGDHFDKSRIVLGQLMDALEIGDLELAPARSSALDDPALVAVLGRWTLFIEPLESGIRHLSANDTVHVNAVCRAQVPIP